MTVIRGFDTASTTTRYAEALARDGMRFAGRYLTRADDWRTLHRPEVDALHKAGIAILPIFQHRSNTPAYFTAHNAETDAAAAIARAKLLKIPANVSITFAVDTDVTAQNEQGVLEYARIVWEKMRTTAWLLGWYGDDRVIKRVLTDLDAGHVAYLAQARGWREKAIPDDWDILQKMDRLHPSGIMIDDCEIALVDDNERYTLAGVGAWLP